LVWWRRRIYAAKISLKFCRFSADFGGNLTSLCISIASSTPSTTRLQVNLKLSTMPLPFIGEILFNGVPSIPSSWTILKVVLAIVVVGLIKWLSTGASNTSERQMHGKIVMITGGTSGIGAAMN
jgi:hypothetical protein